MRTQQCCKAAARTSRSNAITRREEFRKASMLISVGCMPLLDCAIDFNNCFNLAPTRAAPHQQL